MRAAAAEPAEGLWALPNGWQWELLGDLGTWSGGGTPSKARVDFWTGGTIPWVSPKDMKRPVIDSAEDLITEAAVVESSTKIIKSGAVLCVMRSGILRHTFPVAVTVVDATLNQDMRALTPNAGVDPHYVAHFLRSTGNLILDRCGKDGTTVNSIEAERLGRHPVPVPPLDTQRQIVARIDALFAEVEEGEAALARARADLGIWRKALLKAAVTGELTADWRAERLREGLPQETGTDLLARILTERRTRWHAEPRNKGKRYVEPAGPDTDDMPELPEGWAWASVEQIGRVVTGGTPPTGDVTSYDGEVQFFTPGDLDAGFDLSVTRRTISIAGLAKIRSIPSRSILVTCIGATIGKVGFNSVAGATNQQINTLIPDTSQIAEYLFYYFDGSGKYRVVDGASSTTIPILNKGDFCRLPVPIPPVVEAIKIAGLVTAHILLANEARDDADECWAGAATLRQSILAAAFRGALAT